MLQNYGKIAWRNLFRNKLHSAVNIGGLVIGFTVGIAILLVVVQQFQWDHQHVNGKRLYEVYGLWHEPEKDNYATGFALGPGPAYKAEAPGIERMTRLGDGGNHVEYKGRIITIPVMTVDADFLSMFTIPVVKGRGADALRDLTDVVVTEETAKTIFGNEDPIGKQIKVSTGDLQQAVVVSAVVKDPVASSIRFQILTRIENRSDYAQNRQNWANSSVSLYVELKEGVGQREAEVQMRDVNRKHVPDWYTEMEKKGAKPDVFGDRWATRLLPIKDVHFNATVNGHRATTVSELLITLSVALFIILIACFNFVNIGLAAAFTRSREVGLRKCLGAGRWRLFGQLWGESMLVCTLAFGVSLLLVNVFLRSIPGIDQMRVSLENISETPVFIALMAGLVLFVSLMAGGYPAFVMIRFKVVETLKGRISMNRRSPLRSSLIVLQFVIACVMISCTYIMYRQYHFLTNADVGIAKERLISVPLHDPEKGHGLIAKLRTRLTADPRIASVSGSNINLGRGADHRTVHVGTHFTYRGRDINTLRATVDYDYLKTLGVPLLGGRDFAQGFGADTVENVVVNASMANQLLAAGGSKSSVAGIAAAAGRPETAASMVDKTIVVDSSTRHGWHIVGVFPDFHLYDFSETIEPLTLTLNMNEQIPYIFIKTSGGDMIASMETVRREMAALEPGQDFNGSFVDDNINDWYRQEQTMSLLFSIAAAIAILLSCSGLLAMVLLMIQQRVKEIGVRKVLGASVRSISVLVAREFVALVALAVVIATPIAWMMMQGWISHYPYRVDITFWNFAVVGAAAIGIALVTIAFNTIRAARQNPVASLRSE
jgi:ABC-type antimicrobial peptide transport system permease subunit